MIDILQTIFSGSALVLSFTYIIGGLIVNLNLTRRGITEYQILKVKYLVVGLIFMLHSIGVFAFASIPAFFLLTLAGNRLIMQLLNIISMLAAVSLIVIWAKVPKETLSVLGRWGFWFAISAVGALFPLAVLIRQVLAPRFDVYAVVLMAQALMSGVLAFLAQIYHYSTFYYGRPKPTGALDPIGIGIPTSVQLACSENGAALLESLGVPTAEPGVTGDVLLIDETDRQYIIGLKPVQGQESVQERTLKVSKEVVMAILYKPYHIRRIEDKKTG
jgi:hypothetical protein